MPRPVDSLQATDFPREVLECFDAYVHGALDRRGFIERCAAYVGNVAAATAVLAALRPDFALGQVVAPDDKRITTTRIEIPSPSGNGVIKALVAQPAKLPRGRRPGVVLVVHENRGLNPHIEDIARRLAVDGFIAVAPDALTTLGGYPGDEDQARAQFAKLDSAKLGADFVAAARYALTIKGGNGKLGAVGFCYGGGVVNMLSARVPELRAGVPFYGAPAPLAEVPRIKARLLVQMGGNDARINGMWPAYEEALKQAGVRYEAFIYPGAEHGFNNDTTPRFKRDAAELAWSRTMALFRAELS